MGGWKSKIVTVLVIYFVGFATAIYAIVPGSADKTQDLLAADTSKSFATSFLKSDNFAISFRGQMDKSVKFGKAVICKLGDFLKDKYPSTTGVSGRKR